MSDLFSEEAALILGLMIPFLGILVPVLVIGALGLSHRMVHPPRAFQTDGDSADATAPSPTTPLADARTTAQSDQLAALCERLRESDLLEGLTDDELRQVASIGAHTHVTAGERLVQAGNRGEAVYLILKGEMRLLTHAPVEIPVRIARPGEAIPLAAIIDPPVVVTTVEAVTNCDLFAIPRRPLLDLLEANPAMGFQVYKSAAKLFEHRYRRILEHSVFKGDFDVPQD